MLQVYTLNRFASFCHTAWCDDNILLCATDGGELEQKEAIREGLYSTKQAHTWQGR